MPTPRRLSALKNQLAGRRPRRLAVPGAAEAAVAVIFCRRGEGLELLFIRRAVDPRDPWSGQIGLPGGRREDSDPDLLATAIRETREETAIALAPAELLGELDDVHPTGRGLPSVVVRPFVFGLRERPEIRAGAEVAAHYWIARRTLLASETTAEIRRGAVARRVRAFRVGELAIWGLTRRIIAPLLKSLESCASSPRSSRRARRA